MMDGQFTQAEHDRIAAAIKAAEAETSGEIYCVLAHDSDGYFFPAAFVLAAAILAVSFLAAVWLDWQWRPVAIWHFAAAQVLAFGGALAVVVAMPSLRLHLVPRGLLERRAHQNAAKQFLSRNIHRTTARTGVLIFVSVAERYAEIIADTGIDERVGPEAWTGIVDMLIEQARRDRLADGFVEAIGAVGLLLAEHFPVGPVDRNELDDHLVEI